MAAGAPAFMIELCAVKEGVSTSMGPFNKMDPAATVRVLMLPGMVPKAASPEPVETEMFSEVVP